MLRLLFAIVLLLSLPAHAKNDKAGKGKGHGSPPHAGHGHPGHDDGDRDDRHRDRDHRDWRRFSDADRDFWHDYWRDEYARGHCPPGLAKKRNGCLPPGQARKRYAIGRPLPDGVVLVAVPLPLLHRLPPCERGYRYAMVDGDLVKLAVGTALVVDAIDGLLR